MKERPDGNIFLNEPTGELTFSKIFKVLKFSLTRIIAYALIAVVIASCVSLILGAVEISRKEVFTILEYSYAGINEGKYPDGDPFNKDAIKDNSVLKTAVHNANLPALDDRLIELYSHITVEDIIPADKLALINDLKNSANKSADLNEKLNGITFHSTRFIVSLDRYDDLGLKRKQAVRLLDEIVKAHKDSWEKNFVKNPVLSYALVSKLADANASEAESRSSAIEYEHFQYEFLLGIEIANIKTFLEANKSISHGYGKDGQIVTYKSLLTSLEGIEKTALSEYVAYVRGNNIIDDVGTLRSLLNNKIKKLNESTSQQDKTIENIRDQLKNIQQNSSQVFDSGSKITTTYYYTPDYWALHKQLLSLQQKNTNDKTELTLTEKLLGEIEDAENSSSEELAEADNRLIKTAKKIKEVGDLANDLTKDYKEYSTLTDSVRKAIPVHAGSENNTTKMAILVTYVLSVLIAFIAAVSVTVKLQKRFAFEEFGKKDRSENGSEKTAPTAENAGEKRDGENN